LDSNIKEYEFRRMPLFYTLFVATYDLKYTLGNTNKKTRGKKLKSDLLAKVQTDLIKINTTVSGDDFYKEFETFYSASKSSTDKINNRTIRHNTLKNILNSVY